MVNYFDAFIAKLQEIFMMDHAELDFGIYRIMNQKRHDIDVFLKTKLLPQVQADLAGAVNTDAEADRRRMAEILQQLGTDNIETQRGSTMPLIVGLVEEYDHLQTKLANSSDMEELQAQVFSHLVTFFSRYYDGGDFISKRRYKENTYAIPYNGEEVKLHWANSDQYYIKTSEYFRDYSFRLPTSRRKVHFILRDASTEQNNNKSQNNMERRFAIWQQEGESDPVVEVNTDGDLCIYFSYELMPKATKQDELLKQAFATIQPLITADFAELLSVKSPTKKEPNRTLLEKHLTDYTAKNSFDYFIHKDLGAFLRREMDFYIKNEVLHIDDLDPQHVASQLTVVKAIKNVGEKIIRMLAQLEDFQKKLWLKKKFVLQSDYCITLDRVPESLYADIIANDAQREEWVRLFAIDEIKGDGMFTEGYSEPLTIEFLKQNPFLVLDTAFFPPSFKHKLVKSIENIDEQINGLLINSENFQALELLQEKYRNRIKTIYADPPYNTSASEIAYKNNYKNSSWLSLIHDRLLLGKGLLSADGIQCTTIDDVEQSKLNLLLESVFEEQPEVVAIRIKPSGRPIPNGFAISHEYGLFSKKNEKTAISRLSRSGEQLARYRERDEKGPFFWEMLRKAGSNSHRANRPTMYYPFYWNPETNVFRLPDMEYSDNDKAYIIHESPMPSEKVIYPIKDDGSEGCWYFGLENIKDHISMLKAEIQQDGKIFVYYRRRPNEGVQPLTTWGDAKYSATEHGTDLLKKMDIPFDYPKSIHAVEDCLRVAGCHSDAYILDYFGGSGTTSHAVLNLNKDDQGKRRYILCDMAEYFDPALRTRTERAIYSSDWENGKPVSRQGISQCFKYIRLEQYEDTLNNLQLKVQQTTATDGPFHESYMLGYWLDTETRDSLLNLQWFENPFAMTLKATRDNELVETPVDMVETFNFLIGLDVETETWHKDDNICVITGRTHRNGLKTLVIWRNCKEIDNKALDDFFDRMDFRTRDSEFDVIYVNGDNTLPNLRRDEEHWKVVLTEEEFQKRMFTED